jgi:hypothetical protein
LNHASRRATWRGAALLALLFAACGGDKDHTIPIGRTDDDLVVRTKQLESALASSTVKSATRSEKDDQATSWDHRFEEQVDPPKDGVVRRRFRATVTNRSDKARAIRLDIDYLEPGTRIPLKHRMLRTVVVPPFTETSISGYTRFRDTREVLTELRAVEVEPTE